MGSKYEDRVSDDDAEPPRRPSFTAFAFIRINKVSSLTVISPWFVSCHSLSFLEPTDSLPPGKLYLLVVGLAWALSRFYTSILTSTITCTARQYSLYSILVVLDKRLTIHSHRPMVISCNGLIFLELTDTSPPGELYLLVIVFYTSMSAPTITCTARPHSLHSMLVVLDKRLIIDNHQPRVCIL